jgi:hypothetical protein
LSYATWQAYALVTALTFMFLVCLVGVLRIGLARNSLRSALLQTGILAGVLAAHVVYLAERGNDFETILKASVVYLEWVLICVYMSFSRKDERAASSGVVDE